MMTRTPWTLLAAIVILAACGGAKDAPAPTDDVGTSTTAPAQTGTVITIEMHTDETGNYFKPAEVEAHPGDVLRFTLVSGVHNVHFVADSNPSVTNPPPVSDMLQLPGQTFDVPVTMPAGGRYYFQCDPHALLGMVGHVKVESES